MIAFREIYLLSRERKLLAKGRQNIGLSSSLVVLVSISIAVLCGVIAYFQFYGESNDYARYDIFFGSLRRDPDFETRFEIGFVVLSRLLVSVVDNNLLLYAILVSFAVLIKAVTFSKFSPSIFAYLFCLLFFILRFLPHHELTQLRLSISLAFLLMAFLFFDSRSWFKFFLAIFGAVLFHNSAVLSIPVFFLRFDRRWSALAFSCALGVALYLVMKYVLGALSELFYVVSMHDEEGFGDDLRPFSATIVLDLVMIFFGLLFWGKSSLLMRKVLLFQMIGMAIFYGAFEYGVIAQRGREYFTVLWVFYVAQAFGSGRGLALGALFFGVLSMALYTYIFVITGSFSQVV